MSRTAELVLDSRAELGEGPIWDDELGILYWVDSRGDSLNTFDPASGEIQAYDIDLDTLYITSARYGLTEEQLQGEPHAGGVFTVKPGYHGLPAYRFGG